MTTAANVIPLFARVKINGIEVHQGPPDCASPRKNSTSEKLDWLTAMVADRRLDARAKVVAFCIRQHHNQETGTAYVSDQTISDKTGIPKRWVQRARNALRGTGWIDWRRTRTANVYWTLIGPMAEITAQQWELKQQRQEKRMGKIKQLPPMDKADACPKAAAHDQPQMAEPNPPSPPSAGIGALPRVSELELPGVAEHDLPRMADIPLSTNPFEEPLSKNISANGSSDFE
ncbi:MAG TPA: hypothetical protein VNY75_03115, partial [Rhizomicrobium sp.]|nr:hypothetical protein [Rhizomicrobium sp.]